MKFIVSAIEEIIKDYKGSPPLNLFLKTYFKSKPKLGSRDRKAITDAVYAYYRLERFIQNPETQLWLMLSWAIQQNIISNAIIEKIIPSNLNEKLDFNWEIFSPDFFSEGIQNQEWSASILKQAKTFIRIRKGYRLKVLAFLSQEQIAFSEISDNILSFENGVKLQQFLPQEAYVIQDYSSQRSLDILRNVIQKDAAFNVWDVCSGAGGKTILFKDLFPNASILCTDIRSTILFNLRERVKLYGIKNIKTQVLDISKANAQNAIAQNFDIVITDVPCSGSGTWSRTPEQLYFFNIEKIRSFHELQTEIIFNASQKVKPGAYLNYITCSVFKEENEEVIKKFLTRNQDFQLVEQLLINGIPDQADCMFVAVLRKKE
ncbi:MAG TPA: hypothetical protein PKX92_07545 [Edaphocola sp.]|nr:hypothetical protein [Edaphocola sp.]